MNAYTDAHDRARERRDRARREAARPFDPIARLRQLDRSSPEYEAARRLLLIGVDPFIVPRDDGIRPDGYTTVHLADYYRPRDNYTLPLTPHDWPVNAATGLDIYAAANAALRVRGRS